MKRTIEHLKEVIAICNKEIARNSEILKKEDPKAEKHNNLYTDNYAAFLKMVAHRNIKELQRIRHNAFVNLNQEKMRKWGK